MVPAWLRRRVGAVIGTLENHSGLRTVEGLRAGVCQRNAAIGHHRLIGTPVKRSLTAHDPWPRHTCPSAIQGVPGGWRVPRAVPAVHPPHGR